MPGWPRAPGQVEPGDEALAAGISALLAGLPAAEVIARAHAAGVPAVRARQARELTADERLIRHGLLTVIDRDDHGVTWVGPGRWLEMPGLAAREPRNAPAAGEHTELIRREGRPGLLTPRPGQAAAVTELAPQCPGAAGRSRVRVRFVHVLRAG